MLEINEICHIVKDSTERDDAKRACQIKAHGHAQDILNDYELKLLQIYVDQFNSSIYQALSARKLQLVYEATERSNDALEIDKIIAKLNK
jgi:hypothetical protein